MKLMILIALRALLKLSQKSNTRHNPPISHVNDADISLINGFLRMQQKEINISVPVVILEVIRDFYDSAPFFFSFEEDWSFQITKAEIAETKRIVTKQLQTIVSEGMYVPSQMFGI